MNVAQWIIMAGAVVGALGILYRGLVQPVVKWARRLENAVTHVENNMRNNGGTSLRDAIDRIETRLSQVENHLTTPR